MTQSLNGSRTLTTNPRTRLSTSTLSISTHRSQTSSELLNKAITFASEYDKITAKERHVIIQAKNSLLFSETEAWCKKDSSSNFDVTMGSLVKVFSDNKPKLTIEANKNCVNFLDITFDLRSGTFKPYTKPGNVPQFVNVQSNHPPSILRRIPETINQRLSRISFDKQSFDASTRPY